MAWAGEEHTCAVLRTGAVRCWGLNLEGQLGYDDTSNVGDGTAGRSIIEMGDVAVGGGVPTVFHHGNALPIQRAQLGERPALVRATQDEPQTCGHSVAPTAPVPSGTGRRVVSRLVPLSTKRTPSVSRETAYPST